MRDAVRAAFVEFTAPLEGVVPWLYQDVKGLITVAIGNLVDPIQYALPLPFVHRDDGRPATRDEIAAEWMRVKAAPDLARLGHRAAERIATLRLTDDGIASLVARKLEQNDRHLAARFGSAQWEEWSADSQLCILSLSWACGAGFRFPMFEAAIRAGDWELAERECTISEAGNAGIKPRNAANRLLLRNAAHVAAHGLDPDVLYWPRDLTAAPPSAAPPSTPGPSDEDLAAARIAGTYEAMAEMCAGLADDDEGEGEG